MRAAAKEPWDIITFRNQRRHRRLNRHDGFAFLFEHVLPRHPVRTANQARAYW
jgi:hypothetical protein